MSFEQRRGLRELTGLPELPEIDPDVLEWLQDDLVETVPGSTWEGVDGIPLSVLEHFGKDVEVSLKAVMGMAVKEVFRLYFRHSREIKKVASRVSLAGARPRSCVHFTGMVFPQEVRRFIVRELSGVPHAPVFEYRLVNLYDPAAGALEPDMEMLATVLDWGTPLTVRLELLDARSLGYVMELPRLYADLDGWSGMDEDTRVRLSLALYGVASILFARKVLDEAIAQVPELGEYYTGVAFSENDDGFKRGYVAPADAEEERYLGPIYTAIDDLQRCFDAGEPPARVYEILTRLNREFDRARSYAAGWYRDAIGEALDGIDKLLQDLSFDALPARTSAPDVAWRKTVVKASAFYRAAVADEALGMEQLDVLYGHLVEFEQAFLTLERETRGVNLEIGEARDSLRALADEDPVAHARPIGDLAARIGELGGELDALLGRRLDWSPPSLRDAGDGAEHAGEAGEAAQLRDVLSERDAELAAARFESDDLRRELDGSATTIFQLRAQVNALEAARDAGVALRESGFSSSGRDSLLACFAGTGTPRQALEALEALYAPDVVVLDSAYASADASSHFKNRRRLWELLLALAGPYREALVSGKPDGEARRVFGGAYRARESESTIETADFRAQRVFRYRGEERVFVRHLALGVSADPNETIRIYFEWFADEHRIVIAYCGEHLDTVGSASL